MPFPSSGDETSNNQGPDCMRYYFGYSQIVSHDIREFNVTSEEYFPGLDCWYLIDPPLASSVIIKLSFFDISPGDYLEIYDNFYSTANLLANYSGQHFFYEPLIFVNSTTGRALLHFKSNNDSMTGDGFYLKYAATSRWRTTHIFC